jgi:hypothetical protein
MLCGGKNAFATVMVMGKTDVHDTTGCETLNFKL